MIKDYLYAIGKYLPASQKSDVLKDIEANLYDYLEENFGVKDYSNEEIEKAILFMGNPKKVAEGYLNRPRCLIGPPYLDIYLLVVKLAVGGVAIGITVSLLISFSNITQFPEFILRLLSGLWQAGISAVGTVTLIFAALYHYYPDNEDFNTEEWDIKKLEKAPEESDKVTLSDVIFESLFSIFLLIYLNQGQFLRFIGSERNIPGLNDAVFSPYLLWFNLIMSATLLLNLYLLIKRKWQFGTRMISILLDIAGIWLFGVLAFTPNIWDFSNIQGITPDALEGINTALQLGLKIGLGAIVVVTSIETFKHLRKMLKKK